jgi:hypothetical protein
MKVGFDDPNLGTSVESGFGLSGHLRRAAL